MGRGLSPTKQKKEIKNNYVVNCSIKHWLECSLLAGMGNAL